MGELGDALALMQQAHDRVRTLRATVREWYDVERERLAIERFLASPEGSGLDSFFRREPGISNSSRTESLAVPESTVRLWVKKPDWIREERDIDEREFVMLLSTPDGNFNGRFDQHSGKLLQVPPAGVLAMAGGPHESEQLLDPSSLLDSFRFELADRSTVAGRAAIVLRARRRLGMTTSPLSFLRLTAAHLSRFGFDDAHEAEEFELALDAERGIILRSAALSGGEEYRASELLEVAFDERLGRRTFRPVALNDRRD